MLLISTQNITLKLKYYFNNNGQHYFQRSVPRANPDAFLTKKSTEKIAEQLDMF